MNKYGLDDPIRELARRTTRPEARTSPRGSFLPALLVLTLSVGAPAARASDPQSQHFYLALGAS
jgi:hypothetical protein